MSFLRKIAPVFVVGGLVLTGCTGNVPQKDSAGVACPKTVAYDQQKVKVKGESVAKMKITSDLPKVKKPLRVILKDGSGDLLKVDQELQVEAAFYVGEKPKEMQKVEKTTVRFNSKELTPGIYDAFRCMRSGEFSMLYGSVEQLFGKDATPAGMEADEPFLIAVKIVSSKTEKDSGKNDKAAADAPPALEKPQGVEQQIPEGLPTLKLDDKGDPVPVMPEGKNPPADAQHFAQIKGDGQEVQPGDSVTVNYRGVVWRTGQEFDASFTRGAPAVFQTDQVVKGFQAALEGETVGSRVVAVVPPKDGYGEGTATSLKSGKPDFDVTNEDTLVFVIDILGTSSAAAK